MEPFGDVVSNRLDLVIEEESDIFLFSGYHKAMLLQNSEGYLHCILQHVEASPYSGFLPSARPLSL